MFWHAQNSHNIKFIAILFNLLHPNKSSGQIRAHNIIQFLSCFTFFFLFCTIKLKFFFCVELGSHFTDINQIMVESERYAFTSKPAYILDLSVISRKLRKISGSTETIISLKFLVLGITY